MHHLEVLLERRHRVLEGRRLRRRGLVGLLGALALRGGGGGMRLPR